MKPFGRAPVILWDYPNSAVRRGTPTVEMATSLRQLMKAMQSRTQESGQFNGSFRSARAKDQEHPSLSSSAQPKNSPPSGLAKISLIPLRSNQNASEPKSKALTSLAKANTRKNQPVVRLGSNAGKVGPRTTPQDLSRRTPDRQPVTIPMPSQETSISDPSFHASSVPKHFHEVTGLLATARRDRGWPAFEVQRQLELQRNMLIDERTVLECLEEGVRLGILTQKTNPPAGGRLIPLTFYAIKKLVE